MKLKLIVAVGFAVLFGLIAVGPSAFAAKSSQDGVIAVKITKKGDTSKKRPKADIYLATPNTQAVCYYNGKKVQAYPSLFLGADKDSSYREFAVISKKKGYSKFTCTPGQYYISVYPYGRYHASYNDSDTLRSVNVAKGKIVKVNFNIYANKPAPNPEASKKVVRKFISAISKPSLAERKKAFSIMTPIFIKDTNKYCQGDPQCFINNNPPKKYKLRAYSDDGFVYVLQQTSSYGGIDYVVVEENGKLLIDSVEDDR